MLIDTITDILPMSAGIALSPIPIAAVVSILLSARSQNAPLFLTGWVAGLLVIGLLMLFFPGLRMLDGEPTQFAGWLRVVMGSLLMIIAWKKWQKRSSSEDVAGQPKLLAQLDSYGSWKSLMLGFSLATFNPKSLFLAMAAAMTIYSSKVTGKQQVIVMIIFALFSSLTVIVPVVAYRFQGEKAKDTLADLKEWLVVNNTAVTVTLLVVFAILLFGSGLKIIF